MTSLAGAAYSAIQSNEASGKASLADSLTPPDSNSSKNGSGGWTIGFDQEDFNTNGTIAQATLRTALELSGNFTSAQATNIATAFTNAGTTTNVNLAGINDIRGNPTSSLEIQAALATPAAAASINTASLNNFTNSFNSLTSSVFDSSHLQSSVQSALSDPINGPLLEIILADYNNQYGLSTTGTTHPMWDLLTTGTGVFNGNTVTISTTDPSTVVEGVMTGVLDTLWVSKGNGLSATRRLSNDVAEAYAYDTARCESAKWCIDHLLRIRNWCNNAKFERQ